ncbi:transposase [Micromonospora sp. NPDC005305]|uniref:transposase n=1 Tax=Micromonospora sp. NPDC005305 TaxID=3156875 RepID=UPI0033B06D3F
MGLFGVGPDVAAQLLTTTAGDNPDRLHSEAALAHLGGATLIPASSGPVRRHRLHRGRRPRRQSRPAHHRSVPHTPGRANTRLAPSPHHRWAQQARGSSRAVNPLDSWRAPLCGLGLQAGL